MSDPNDLFSLSALSREVGESYGDTSEISLEKCKRALNRALWLVNRKGRWIFSNVEDNTFDTVSGEDHYVLKAGVKEPEYLRTIDPARKIMRVDRRKLLTAIPNNLIVAGAPIYYWVVGYNKPRKAIEIAFYPIPDGIYTVYIDSQYNIPLLVDNDDDIRTVSGIPEEMIPTVIDLAIAVMFDKSDDVRYQQKMAEAELRLDDDFYRLGSNPDENLNARSFDIDMRSVYQDPILPPDYS